MISIVSAYYGNEEMTKAFLDNLQEKCKFQDVEMILVNSGSKVIEHPFITKRVDLSENISFSNSFNAGLKLVSGDYVVIIGNDGFPTSSTWLQELKGTIDSGAMIAAPVWDRPNFESYKHLVLKETEYWAEMQMVPAVCWMLKKESIDEIGLFDERFVPGCYEDDDYCYRVHLSGGKIIVNKTCRIKHLLSQTVGKMDVNSIMQKNYIRYKEKWGYA